MTHPTSRLSLLAFPLWAYAGVAVAQLPSAPPLINGVDVSQAIGTYTMESPQFGCPMTVYGRHTDEGFGVWTPAEASSPPRSQGVHGEGDFRPRYHFMSTGRSHAWYKYKGARSDSYRRSAETRAERAGGGLELYQESLAGLETRGIFSTTRDEHETSRQAIRFSLGVDGAMTLRSRQNDRRGEPPACAYRKASADAGPAVRRSIPYALEAEVLVGPRMGALRGTFDLDEFDAFERDTTLRNFNWTIALHGGETIAPEAPLPSGDWRLKTSGWVSPGVAPLRFGGGIAGALAAAMTRPLERSFIVELESAAYARLAGGEQLLRLFMACDETFTTCALMNSLIDGDDPGFFPTPFPPVAAVPVRSAGGSPVRLTRR